MRLRTGGGTSPEASKFGRIFNPPGASRKTCGSTLESFLAEAEKMIRESLHMWGELGVKQGAAECLEGLADIEMRRLHRKRGLALLAAARSIRANCGAATPAAVRGVLECRLHQWLPLVEGGERTYTIDEAVRLGLGPGLS